jgi:hypothetical protein
MKSEEWGGMRGGMTWAESPKESKSKSKRVRARSRDGGHGSALILMPIIWMVSVGYSMATQG